MLKRLLLTTLFAVGLAAAGALGASAQSKVTISMASGVNQVPSLVAKAKGYFKDEGLDVELKPVGRGQIALEALAAGSIEFAESSHTAFFAAVDKGVPLMGVGVAARGYYGKLIAANRNANLKTLADFKGKRIGTQVGTGMHMVLLMLLEKNGLKESDFEITNIRVSDMPAAMATSDTFDAVLGWEPGMQRIVQGGHGKEVITAREIEVMAGITYPFILTTTQDFHKNNPKAVQGVVNAYSKAHKYIRENPDDAVKIYKDFLDSTGANLDAETVRYMMFDTERFGGAAFTEEDWADLPATIAYLRKTGKLDTDLDLSKIIDRSIGEKAEAAIK